MFDPIIREPLFGPRRVKERRPIRARRAEPYSHESQGHEPAIRFDALKWWCLSFVPRLRPSVRLACA